MSGWGNQGNQGNQWGNQGGWGTGAQGTNQWGTQQQGTNQWGAQQGSNVQGGNQWGTQQGGNQYGQPAGQWGTQQQQGANQWGAQQGGNQWGAQQGTNQYGQQGGTQWGGQQQPNTQWNANQNQNQNKGIFGLPSILNFGKKRNNANGKFNKREYYSIVSDKAGRVIDVAQSGQNKGFTIIWDGYNGDNQAFGVIQDGAQYYLKCRQGGGYLTVQSEADGAKLFLSPQPTPRSRFVIDETSSGSRKYFIYTFCNKVLDLYQGIKQNGNIVMQWTFNGNSNQVWYFNNPKDISSSSSEREH